MQAQQGDYYSQLRHDLVAAIAPARPSRALDVGCADGSTGVLIKERYPHCAVTGIEPTPAADLARRRIDRVLRGGVEEFLGTFGDGAFDLVLLGDVLEHLVNPWSVLATIARWLAPDGVLVATVPNIRNWRIVRDLALRGRWEYVEAGILDRGHVRFFTASSARALIEGAGLRIDRFDMIVPHRAAVVDRATIGLFRGVLAQKHLIRALR